MTTYSVQYPLDTPTRRPTWLLDVLRHWHVAPGVLLALPGVLIVATQTPWWLPRAAAVVGTTTSSCCSAVASDSMDVLLLAMLTGHPALATTANRIHS